MRRQDYVKKRFSFTASIDDTQIYTPKALINLHLNLQGSMTAASSVPASAILGLINPFEFKFGAVPRIRLDGEEIFVLNQIFLERVPNMQTAGATVGDKSRVLDMVIPMNYAAGAGPLYFNITRTAVSGVGTELLDIIAEYSDAAPAERPLQLLRYNYTPTATGTFLKALERITMGTVEGILFRSTTVPTNTSDNASLKDLEVYVGGELMTRTNIFELVEPIEYIDDVAGTATSKLFKNWGFLDLRKEPIPSGASLRIDILSDDTGAIRIIPIERLA
jgi:hypothetical protein